MKKYYFPVILSFIASSLLSQPGIIIIDPPHPMPPRTAGLYELELRNAKVETKIVNQTATTKLEQVFYNPTAAVVQGYYYLPIPSATVVKKFSMSINGKETEGELLDAEKAKQIYEDIVRRYRDPALLEYYSQSLFRVKIFPVAPRSEQTIKIEFTNLLTRENGMTEYWLPLRQSAVSKSSIQNLAVKVDIEASDPIKTIYSPTHEVEINRKSERHAIIGLEGKNLQPEQDFKLYFNTNASPLGASLMCYNDGVEEGYFFLTISPGLNEKEGNIVDKDISFVVDASGSMAGEKMEQTKKALQYCVNTLHSGDRFNIIRFSTDVTPLFDDLGKADRDHLDKANTFIKDMKAIGGTNIDEALMQALAVPKDPTRPHFIVFLTDGKPTIGETNVDALMNKVKSLNHGNTRIFTFGIGTDLNAILLDKLTDLTKAFRTYVLPNEDIELKVSDFFNKVSSPILTDLELSFDKPVEVSQVYPHQLPDLFKGSELIIFGRYKGDGKVQVNLKGKVNEEHQNLSWPLEFDKKTKENDFIPSLWATRAVGYLLEQIRLNGENKELVEEVTRLARKHGIITPYTSYLIMEDERRDLGMGNIRKEDMILNNRVEKAQQPAAFKENYKNKLQKAEGVIAVQSSSDLQDMNGSYNMEQKQASAKNMVYLDSSGNSQNLAQGVRNLQGRALYHNNGQWLDSNIALGGNQNAKKTERILFASEAYFKLLKDQPISRNFLALGNNVRFELNGQVYEVYE